MKKHYLAWILVGSLTFTLACQPKTEESASTDTTEETAEEAPEKRPSPLVKKEGQVAGKTIKVQYGSPSVKGRTIWGDLVPYNVVLRVEAQPQWEETSQETLSIDVESPGLVIRWEKLKLPITIQ